MKKNVNYLVSVILLSLFAVQGAGAEAAAFLDAERQAELISNPDMAVSAAREAPGLLAGLALHLDLKGDKEGAWTMARLAIANENGSHGRAALLHYLELAWARGSWPLVSEEAPLILSNLARIKGWKPATLPRTLRECWEYLAGFRAKPGEEVSGPEDRATELAVMSSLALAWYQNGEFGLLEKALALASDWNPEQTGPWRPLLTYGRSLDETLAGAAFESSQRGNAGSRAWFRLVLRYEASERLTAWFRDQKAMDAMLADSRTALTVLLGEALVEDLGILAEIPGRNELEWLMLLKTRVQSGAYQQAWAMVKKEWTESGAALFTRWRAMAALQEDRDFSGFLKDAYNAGRLSGNVSETAQVLESMADALGGPGRVHAMELSARLWRAAGNGAKARGMFDAAADLALAEGMAQVDEQRVRWYAMREYALMNSPQLAALTRLAAGIRDKPYFSDVWEDLYLNQAGRKGWEYLYSILRSNGESMSPNMRAKYQAALGRHYMLENRKSPSRTRADRADDLLTAARAQGESLYYHAVASWLLDKPIEVERVLAYQASLARSPRETAGQVARDRVELLLSMLERGLDEGVNNRLTALRMSMDADELMRAAGGFAARGALPVSVKFADYRRAYFAHSSERKALELMYPFPYADMVRGESERQSVPWQILLGVLRTESFFDPKAESHAGAQGISQFMPATAKAVAKALKREEYDIFDPATGIAFSAYYLRDLQRSMKTWSKTLGAYNAGGSRMRSAEKRLGSDQFLFNEGLTIEETRNYIRRILESSLVYDYLYAREPDPDLLVQVFLKGP